MEAESQSMGGIQGEAALQAGTEAEAMDHCLLLLAPDSSPQSPPWVLALVMDYDSEYVS